MAHMVNMGDLETDEKSKAQRDDADYYLAQEINHNEPPLPPDSVSFSGFPLKFSDKGCNRPHFFTLLGNHEEPSRIIPRCQLEPYDNSNNNHDHATDQVNHNIIHLISLYSFMNERSDKIILKSGKNRRYGT